MPLEMYQVYYLELYNLKEEKLALTWVSDLH